jgi:signal transduction histidine kinase
VEDLLQLARADEGRLLAHREQVDIDDLVLAEVRRLRTQGSITVDASGIGAGRVVGDPKQLGRMLRNLVDNAHRHASSRVSVAVSQRAGTVVLDVGNDGPPIAAGDRELVFQRFARLDGARTRDDGGSGLGLAIVAETVAAHGGSVRVDEIDGHTHFVVSLPAEQDDPADAGA